MFVRCSVCVEFLLVGIKGKEVLIKAGNVEE